MQITYCLQQLLHIFNLRDEKINANQTFFDTNNRQTVNFET
jgi:hypothetical protein